VAAYISTHGTGTSDPALPFPANVRRACSAAISASQLPLIFQLSEPVIGAGMLLSPARQGGRSTRRIRIRESLLSLTVINVLTEERWENPVTSFLNVKEWRHEKIACRSDSGRFVSGHGNSLC
jgi:hypothetical protein